MGKHVLPDDYNAHIDCFCMVEAFPKTSDGQSQEHQLSLKGGQVARAIFKIVNSSFRDWPSETVLMNDSNDFVKSRQLLV